MRIGIPGEIKTLEGRVALIPAAAGELVVLGHEVFIEAGAGLASGYPDAEYEAAGVSILADATSLYGESEMILKVKEPVGPEYELLRSEHLLFSFLHLAAEKHLAEVLCDIGLTAVGFETVEERGRLPLLVPMSDIAGRLSIHIGTTLLHQHNGGRGILLGGMPAGNGVMWWYWVPALPAVMPFPWRRRWARASRYSPALVRAWRECTLLVQMSPLCLPTAHYCKRRLPLPTCWWVPHLSPVRWHRHW